MISGIKQTRAGYSTSTHHSLRIVHVVSSLNMGGMEQFVLRLARVQRDNGHEVAVLALHGGALEAVAAEMSVRVIVTRSISRLIRIWQVACFYRRFRPVVVHAHNPTSLHYAVIGKLVSRAHVLVTDHAQTRGSTRNQSFMERQLTDKVVAVSKHTARMSSLTGKRPGITVIHNGVDLCCCDEARGKTRFSLGLRDRVVGVMVAGFDVVKGHAVLLTALAMLRDQGILTTLLCAGDGVERAAIERMAAELNLGSDWIRFLGIRADIPELLAASDYFVLPSMMEGLPLAMLEAMAQRLPVIATPVGGVPEVIENERNGLLVPCGDAKALANAMERLIVNPRLRNRLGEMGHARVCGDLSFETMAAKYEVLYYGLANHSRV